MSDITVAKCQNQLISPCFHVFHMLLLPLPRVLGRLFVPDLPADPFQVSLLLLGEGVVGGEGDPLLLTQLPLLLVQVEPGVLPANRLANQTPLWKEKV